MNDTFTVQQAKAVGEALGVNWTMISLEQFAAGMNLEATMSTENGISNVTHDDAMSIGKIVFSTLSEIPDYYKKLQDFDSVPEFPENF